MTAVDVKYSYADSEGQLRTREFRVVGAPQDPFAPAVRKEIADAHASSGLLLAMSPGRFPAPIQVSDRGTFAEMANFVEGEALPLSSAGIGGQWVVDLWTVISDGLTMYGLYELLRQGRQLEFRQHKAAAQRWALGGTDKRPDATLARLIGAERAWPHAVATRQFGLSRRETVELFAHLGYQYSPEQETWYDQST